MGTEINHNKIIYQAARSVLKNNGLFQKGSSRMWIDDNGWFLIVVEFQPSNWDKGSYLNVSIHYLWQMQDYISFDFGHRENEFVAFSGDAEQFYADMVLLANKALEKVIEYRRFREIEFAKKQILHRNGFASASHELYNKMMILGLAKDSEAKKYCAALLEETKYAEDETAAPLAYDVKYRHELIEEILPLIDDPLAFEQYIKSKIRKQREFWHAKASMKKLSVEEEL